MATYVGETVRIRSTVTDYDDVALTDEDVSTAEVTIYVGATPVVGTLTWDDTRSYWYYDWDTNGMAAGAYKAQVRYVGVAYDTFEFLTIRLRSLPEGVG